MIALSAHLTANWYVPGAPGGWRCEDCLAQEEPLSTPSTSTQAVKQRLAKACQQQQASEKRDTVALTSNLTYMMRRPHKH